jgi:hypothetical protein
VGATGGAWLEEEAKWRHRAERRWSLAAPADRYENSLQIEFAAAHRRLGSVVFISMAIPKHYSKKALKEYITCSYPAAVITGL